MVIFKFKFLAPYKICESDEKQIMVSAEGKTYHYKFNQIFNKDSTQFDIYFNAIQPLVNDLVENRKCSLIFSFGNTNSGKTFTISGNTTNPGILPNSLSQIFTLKKLDSEVILNCIEIYNDNVYDIMYIVISDNDRFCCFCSAFFSI